DHQQNPNQTVSTLNAGDFREITLKRNRFGHYVFDGEINHQKVTFLVDTGATTTAIPGRLQEGLNLSRGISYSVSTANGSATAYRTRLPQMSIGDIELTSVNASIIPAMDTNQVLLGMNVLKHLELVQRGDELIIRQYR
ncbi:MAG: TIGR02281 family clan AA aspartic protease, partial [Pseudomonadota bacterium]